MSKRPEGPRRPGIDVEPFIVEVPALTEAELMDLEAACDRTIQTARQHVASALTLQAFGRRIRRALADSRAKWGTGVQPRRLRVVLDIEPSDDDGAD